MNEYSYFTGREDGRSFWDDRPEEDDSYEKESYAVTLVEYKPPSRLAKLFLNVEADNENECS